MVVCSLQISGKCSKLALDVGVIAKTGVFIANKVIGFPPSFLHERPDLDLNVPAIRLDRMILCQCPDGAEFSLIAEALKKFFTRSEYKVNRAVPCFLLLDQIAAGFKLLHVVHRESSVPDPVLKQRWLRG